MSDYIKREELIKMLPTEFNGIEIGRAISVVDEFLQEHECDELWNAVRALRDWVECVTDEIKEYLPSADVVERKSGKWIETAEGTICSVCNRYPYDDGEYHIANWKSDFCPHCNADMRGKDNE